MLKKLLAGVFAGAMAMSIAVTAHAADSAFYNFRLAPGSQGWFGSLTKESYSTAGEADVDSYGYIDSSGYNTIKVRITKGRNSSAISSSASIRGTSTYPLTYNSAYRNSYVSGLYLNGYTSSGNNSNMFAEGYWTANR